MFIVGNAKNNHLVSLVSLFAVRSGLELPQNKMELVQVMVILSKNSQIPNFKESYLQTIEWENRVCYLLKDECCKKELQFSKQPN